MKQLTTIFIFLSINLISGSQTMNLPIIPTPKFVKPLASDFQVNKNIVLEIRTSVEENISSIELI